MHPRVLAHRKGVPIPKKRIASAVELRLGDFLAKGFSIGPGVVQVLVRLEAWSVVLLSQGFMQNSQAGIDAIDRIASELTYDLIGMEGDFLRKSIQELLLQIAGTESDMTESEFASRMLVFLKRRATAGLLRRFLAVHVFNVVWFQTGDSFRALAWTPNSFVHDMETVEGICRRIVDSTWRARRINGPLDPMSAGELVEHLAQRLMHP